MACRGPSPPARRGRRLSSAARWRVVERRRVSAVGGLLDGGFVSGFESLLVRLLPQVVSDEAVRVPVGVADFDGPGAARDGLVVGGEPFEPAVLVDEREPALASVREVGLSGLPCEYRVAAVGRVSAARVRVGDAVVGDEAGAVAFAEAERVRVPGAHPAVGGEAEVQEERGGFEALPVVHDERERLHVVFVAVAVETLAVVPCDARPVGVGVAHPGELGEAWHGVRLAGDDDAHQIRLLPAVVAFVSLMACVAATRLMARMSRVLSLGTGNFWKNRHMACM